MCSAGRATERSKISLWVSRPQPKPSRNFLLTSNLGYKTDDCGAGCGYYSGEKSALDGRRAFFALGSRCLACSPRLHVLFARFALLPLCFRARARTEAADVFTHSVANAAEKVATFIRIFTRKIRHSSLV